MAVTFQYYLVEFIMAGFFFVDLTSVVSNFSETSVINETVMIVNAEDGGRVIVSLDWDPPDTVNCPPVLEYRVTLDQFDSQLVAETRYLKAEGITPNTTYTVTITPITKGGDGPSLIRSINTTNDGNNSTLLYPV